MLRVKKFQEAEATRSSTTFVFGVASIHDESLKKKLEVKEAEVTKLKQKVFENKKVQHLGCNSEIQNLKSQIANLQEKSRVIPVATLYTPHSVELRANQQEKEIEQLRKKMNQANFDLKNTKNVLEQKEKEYMVKYKKNVDMLKKHIDEK